MLSAYHTRTINLAKAAVATGRPSSIYLSMAMAAAVWTIPAMLAVFICCGLGLNGVAILYVCLPLIGISVAGCCGYIGWVYWRAMMHRS
jgi:hypothetical protein